MKHYKGVQLYTVRNMQNNAAGLRAALLKISALGYDAVHGYLMYGDMDYPMYRDMLNEANLIDCTVSGGDLDALANGEIGEVVKAACIMGVKDVGIDPLPLSMRYTKEGFQYYAERINEAGRRLYEADGLSIAYHNHAMEFASFGGRTGMDILFDHTDPDYVHFILDTHWVVSGGCDPAKWIRKAGKRARIVHFKDYRIVPGANQNFIEGVVKDFAEVGQGNIDWLDVVAACREVNTEFFIVEQDQCPGDPLDSLKISIDKMRELGL